VKAVADCSAHGVFVTAAAGVLAYHPAAYLQEKVMGIGFKELLIILAIALLIFGAKRLKTIGSDLGGAVKGFKKAMNEGDDKESRQLNSPDQKDADFDSTPSAGKTGTKSNV
jgi:sec-independent protein translocase protein TatA